MVEDAFGEVGADFGRMYDRRGCIMIQGSRGFEACGIGVA